MSNLAGLAGRTFGSYLLEAPLGRGGMGEVYRARHLRLANRRAAVKVLPSYFASQPNFLARFEREANSAAALDHPNILPVWDYGEQDGIPYLAMPLVPGGNLGELLERHGPLPPEEALGYVRQIGAALDYAHQRGIIHRDVKPANILLAEDGRPLLADFGIAKAIEEGQAAAQGLTLAGTGVGTPEYTAPEQVEGRAEPRSDLYSLGVVLYQLLTGELPFGGQTPYEIAYKHMTASLPPIREVNPDLPRSIEPLIARALAKDPARRYASGAEFAAAFDAALAAPAGAAGAGAADPTGVVSPHDLRTTPLNVVPGPTGPPPEPLYGEPPVERTQVYAPASPPPPSQPPLRGFYAPPPAPPAPPTRAAPPTRGPNRWPLVVASLLGLLLLLGLGGALALAALNRPDPTPTPDAPGTSTAQANATSIVVATAAAAATQDASAAQAAQAAQAGTATANAIAQGTQAAQGTAAAAAAAAATATAASNAAVEATAQAQAQAATAAARANATATAGAAAIASQTAAASAAGTATAQARPSPTPVPPTPTLTAPAAARTPTAAGGTWGPTLEPLTGGKAYTDPDERFSFRVPQDWSESQTGNAEVTFVAPRGAAALPPNMNVTLEEVPGNATLDAYTQAAEGQLRQEIADYRQVSLDRVVLAGNTPAYRRVFTGTISGVPVQVSQIYLVERRTAHVLTFVASPDAFAQQARTFDAIAGSYRIGTP